ncbi:hypothetical protein F4692_002462 [Nocardioides cavernae]|uniref:Exo-alpha-sialidase n=1 Tax=Nocardioides cavernae TaxID=1921566 RepID=A0A7Y9H4Z6_9ACTN|nr:hypothetical protein [Nocardioides cavernae]NYE37329.1 hypothetical protein [Nocardioides cavernae]
MSLPTDFHREVAERVDPPRFDVVLDRARAARRRRRATTVAGLLAACAVTGLAWGVAPGRDTGPAPATPAPTPSEQVPGVDPRLPADVRDVLASDMLHPWQVVGSTGAVAAVWGDCADGCRFALVTRLGDRVHGTLLEGDSPTIAEVSGGWLVQDGGDTFRISPDGRRDPVVDPGGTPVPPEPGDVVVRTTDGLRILRGTTLLPVPSPDGTPVLAAYATAAGDLVVALPQGTGGVEVRWTTGDGLWFQGLVSRPGGGAVAAVEMAGHHDGVAIALLGDAPDGSVPVLGVASSQDAGRTWTTARGVDGLADLSGLAVSDEGSAYLTTGSTGTVQVAEGDSVDVATGAGVVRVDATGDVTSVRQSQHDSSVFGVSHRVCVVAEAGRVDRLSCSPDDGTTWGGQPLPGFV